MNTEWKKLFLYLVHDFKGFTVDEDVSKTQKNLEMAKKMGFDGTDLVDVVDFLNSHKEELPT
jgi:hypothetical protein